MNLIVRFPVFLCSLTFVLISSNLFSQNTLPVFLGGTWKVHDRDVFEHWDVMNEKLMKGLSYENVKGNVKVREYLDISFIADEVFYRAFLRDQNKGTGISFKMIKNDSLLVFENPGHDFPTKISYMKKGDNELLVRVENHKGEGFEYKMIRQSVINEVNDTQNPNYDRELATNLRADDYGMKSYFFVILKTGKADQTDAAFVQKCFRGHMENINRLVQEKKLIVAGPFGKNEESYRGLFILNDIKNKEEAMVLLNTDPAVKEGLLDVMILDWYGSAALPEYLEAADRIWKVKP